MSTYHTSKYTPQASQLSSASKPTIANNIQQALAYADAGLNVLPTIPDLYAYHKTPSCYTHNGVPFHLQWAQYQQRKPSKDQLFTWFASHPNLNFGIITGPTSAPPGYTLEILDFDSSHIWDAYQRHPAVKPILRETVIEYAKHGTAHVAYRVTREGLPTHPQKLAMRRYRHSASRRDRGLIELLTNGKFCVIAPNRRYTVIHNTWEHVPIISIEARETLMAIAQQYDQRSSHRRTKAVSLSSSHLNSTTPATPTHPLPTLHPTYPEEKTVPPQNINPPNPEAETLEVNFHKLYTEEKAFSIPSVHPLDPEVKTWEMNFHMLDLWEIPDYLPSLISSPYPPDPEDLSSSFSFSLASHKTIPASRIASCEAEKKKKERANSSPKMKKFKYLEHIARYHTDEQIVRKRLLPLLGLDPTTPIGASIHCPCGDHASGVDAHKSGVFLGPSDQYTTYGVYCFTNQKYYTLVSLYYRRCSARIFDIDKPPERGQETKQYVALWQLWSVKMLVDANVLMTPNACASVRSLPKTCTADEHRLYDVYTSVRRIRAHTDGWHAPLPFSWRFALDIALHREGWTEYRVRKAMCGLIRAGILVCDGKTHGNARGQRCTLWKIGSRRLWQACEAYPQPVRSRMNIAESLAAASASYEAASCADTTTHTNRHLSQENDTRKRSAPTTAITCYVCNDHAYHVYIATRAVPPPASYCRGCYDYALHFHLLSQQRDTTKASVWS